MATKHPSSSGFKAPVRPAPPPPAKKQGHFGQQSSDAKPVKNLMDNWDFSFEDAFSKQDSSLFMDNWSEKRVVKKAPPPRPPPPKVSLTAGKNIPKQGARQTSRPSELLSNLIFRRGHKTDSTNQSGHSSISSLPPVVSQVATASLIDLNSPPSSPTPTTRSSSDGLSVDSFGSDGTTSHSHHHSQVESGFEDDSDLFGGMTATPSPIQRDVWASGFSSPADPFSPTYKIPQDPFSPPRKSNISPLPVPAISEPSIPAPGIHFKPTIIRPKIKPNASPSLGRARSPAQNKPTQLVNDKSDDWPLSPPMPTIPPPAPPSELASSCSMIKQDGRTAVPHCVALYDFEASQSDDLSFKESDVIELVQKVNEEWLRGRLKGKEGIFPANFVRILVPLEDTGGPFATVLYPFAAEKWEDLDLEVGTRVRIISRIDENWLYGEYQGKSGQFPATFVDNVPVNLPLHQS